MPRSRPRILVTVRRTPADAASAADYARRVRYYADAVRAGGGVPTVVTPDDAIPGAFDGLLLAGGADVHPRSYGQPINPAVRETLSIDAARDAMEIELARRALGADVPIFCICRGVQLINVAAGGTLWQDLSLAGVDPRAHDQDGHLPVWEPVHGVSVVPGTHLAEIIGASDTGVNSYHHQAVADPAPGFRIVARAPDGTIEAIESERHRFVLGVQWHPERMVGHHPLQRRLFERFVAAAGGESSGPPLG
ncbi:MAG: gamma-glutamyl-gamma-aminobutyrate hydrolase family protein [Armatimonadetes bacterium]|nr:gamma-glutamyl-gamma-aminobutyrate hydrolase family protein [Armatimonadota bacterium]